MNGPVEKHGLTIEEACTSSGLGKTKLYDEINSGRLKARKVGKRTLILRTDLLEFLEALPRATR